MPQPGVSTYGPPPTGGLDLHDVLEIAGSLLRTAWRWRWMVLGLLALGPAGAALYLSQATPQYAASARLYVEAKGPKIITEQEGVLTQAKNYVHTQAELIKSSSILQTVVDDPNLAELVFFAGATDSVNRLKNAMSISVGRNDEIISVNLRAEKPAEAKLLVDRIVQAYIAYHTTCKKNTAGNVLQLLHQEKTQYEADLQQKLHEMVDFNRNYDLCGLNENNATIEWQQLSQYSSALTDARLKVMQAQAAYDRLADLPSDPNRAAVFLESLRGQGRYMAGGSPEQRLMLELDDLYKRRHEFLAECTPEHPAMAQLQDAIARTETQLAQVKREIISGVVDEAGRELLKAQSLLASLEPEIDRQRSDVRRQQEHSARWAMLQSEVKRLERACDILDGRIKEIDLTEEAGVYNITIVEPASVGAGPVSPRKLIVMAGGVMLGLMAALGLIVLLDFTDGRLRRSEDIVGMLKAPLLGALPKLPVGTPLARMGQWVRLEESSPFARTVKEIRAALMFDRRRIPFRTLLITSAGEGEGKSIFAANLSLALTQGNKRVLLIDAQHKKPICHEIFLQPNQRGLETAIKDDIETEELVQPTANARLEVLTHGPQTSLWGELVESPQFRHKLVQLRREYDFIVIDGPAASAGAEAMVLGASVDAIVAVLDGEKTTRQACRRLAHRLASLPTPLLGAVVNALDGRKGNFDYTHPGASLGGGTRTAMQVQPGGSATAPATPTPVLSKPNGDAWTSTVCTAFVNPPSQEPVGIIHQDGFLRANSASTCATTVAPPADSKTSTEKVLDGFLRQISQMSRQLDQLRKGLDDNDKLGAPD